MSVPEIAVMVDTTDTAPGAIAWERVAELRDEIGEDDFAEVVELFLAEVEEALAMLSDTQGETRIETLHFLKGCTANLGFRHVSELCRLAEVAARNGEADAASRVAAITPAFRASCERFAERPTG